MLLRMTWEKKDELEFIKNIQFYDVAFMTREVKCQSRKSCRKDEWNLWIFLLHNFIISFFFFFFVCNNKKTVINHHQASILWVTKTPKLHGTSFPLILSFFLNLIHKQKLCRPWPWFDNIEENFFFHVSPKKKRTKLNEKKKISQAIYV